MPKKKKAFRWENRIIEFGTKPADQFLAHELNSRRHPAAQREGLRESLDRVGIVKPILESSFSGKVLDGHARIEETLSEDDQTPLPFLVIRCDDEEDEIFILASLDPLSALAEYDADVLDHALSRIDLVRRPIPALASLYDSVRARARDLSQTLAISRPAPRPRVDRDVEQFVIAFTADQFAIVSEAVELARDHFEASSTAADLVAALLETWTNREKRRRRRQDV